MKELISRIYPFLFFLLILSLPFENYIRAVPNLLLILLVVCLPFIIKKEHFRRINQSLFWIYTLFVLYLTVLSVAFGQAAENQHILLRVVFPLVLILLYLPIKNLKSAQYGIIISSLAAIFFSLVKIVVLILETGGFDFSTGKNPVEALPTDRIYIGFLAIMAIVIAYQLGKESKGARKILYHISILLNIVFLFLIVSRMAIITLFVILGLRFFYLRRDRKKFLLGVGVILLVVMASIALNDNVKNRFLLITTNPNRTFIERLMLMEPRTKIWECSFFISPSGKELFSGLGFENTISKLVNCYDWNIADNPERRDWYISQRYNTHNQFFDFYLSAGIGALVLFIIFLAGLVWKCRKDFFSVALLANLILFAMVESFFHRQLGAYFFGMVLILLLTQNLKLNTTERE